jgi:DNA modification methylase
MQGAKSVEWLETATLIPYAKNSRTHSEAQVAQIAGSIKEFGFNNPVLIDEDNGIIAGHGRVLAAQKLGLQAVPCIRLAHLSETQRKAYVIADNRLALNAGWDDQMLTIELQELNAESFDLSLLGFEPDELNALLNPIKETEGLTDEDAVPEVPEEPKTKPGDIYKLGRHRLMCGDSTSIDAVEKLMDGTKVDFILTDPPYNQETDGGFKFEGDIGKNLKKQSADIEHMCNFEPKTVLPNFLLVTESGKMNATVFCNKDLVPNYLNWARDCGFAFNILVWKKPTAIPLGGTYQPDVEYCLVFRKSAKFNPRQPDTTYSKVLEYKRESGLHPTMKPVSMLENQIKIVSDQNDKCLDFFGGSGSTMIACEKLGRINFTMELDPKYCDVIVKRWEDFTGQKAELVI